MDDDEAERSQAELQAEAEHYSALLFANLASTPEKRFLNSIWAARAIQSDRVSAGLKVLSGVPDEAKSDDITSRHAIHPWELETLLNERLSILDNALFQWIPPEEWGVIAGFVNMLRKLENSHSGIYHEPSKILDTIYKIGNRQFEWQQGFYNRENLFRDIYIYGQGKCAEYFAAKHGVSLDEFTKTCFALASQFFDHPLTERGTSFDLIGISRECKESVIRMIARPLALMKAEAAESRGRDIDIAFKASVVRKYPIIELGAARSVLTCPLPDLLFNRMTYGIFYDVIDGGGAVRNEIGKRFESYVEMIMRTRLPNARIDSDFPYRTRKGERRSCDIVLYNECSQISLLLECKALRLRHEARYSDFDHESAGYRDMVKGVCQIWRFASDVRNGYAKRELAAELTGGLLTMDSWFVAAPFRQQAVLDAAVQVCADQHPEVSEENRIPIAFVYMPELESVLAYETEAAVISTFRKLARKEGQGYSFSVAAEDAVKGLKRKDRFPFVSNLGELLPWWIDLQDMKERRAAAKH